MQNYSRQATLPGYSFIKTTNKGIITDMSESKAMVNLGLEIKQGIAVPDYRGRIARGENATSAYTRTGFKIVPCNFKISSRYTVAPSYVLSYKHERWPQVLPTIPGIASATLSNEASARLKRKLRNFTGQSNQLINVVELKDLRRTIGTATGAASKLVKAVLNSKHKGRSLQKFAADQWLNFSFGVLPTLAAVDDAVSSVNAYLERGDQRSTEYGFASEEWSERKTGTTTGSFGCQVDLLGSYKYTRSVKITAGFKFNLRSSEDYTLGKHLGFDISSVVPTAWELLPYSWLIDYFTTAGSFLEDTFAADSSQPIFISESTKLNISGSVTAKPRIITQGTIIDTWVSIPAAYEYYGFQRNSLALLPRAPLRFKTADEVASHATNKLLNLVALLGSRRS